MSDIYIGQSPRPNEGEMICVDPANTAIVMGFWGTCHAVRLVHRGKNDTHICFEIMTEDDGHWFISGGNASSAWLPELIELLTAADKWMREHSTPDMYNGHQLGYNA
jgi:hypothetical protein